MTKIAVCVVTMIINFWGFANMLTAQEMNFLNRQYMEMSVNIDTMVNIDKITVSITLSEQDMKGSESVEKQENNLILALRSLKIDTDKNLRVDNMSSGIESGFFKGRDVVKRKSYLLELDSPTKAFRAMVVCEELKVSAFNIVKTEVSNIDEIELELKKRALAKAKSDCSEILQVVGGELGPILKINVIDANSYAPMYSGAMNVQYKMQGDVSMSNLQDINFKQMKVSANMHVIFAI